MKCPNCSESIPRECRENIDSTEWSGECYRDVGALYTCPNCRAQYRYIANARSGQRLREINQGDPPPHAFGCGDDGNWS